MTFALDVLNNGGWVHIFPEGKVNQTEPGILPFKWGQWRCNGEDDSKPD